MVTGSTLIAAALGVKAWPYAARNSSFTGRRGIGRALIQHAIEQATAAGASRVDLTANSRKQAGHALYRSVGLGAGHRELPPQPDGTERREAALGTTLCLLFTTGREFQ
jgi:ribosomal protein S18 acetylase RimI-like enzyme